MSGVIVDDSCKVPNVHYSICTYSVKWTACSTRDNRTAQLEDIMTSA